MNHTREFLIALLFAPLAVLNAAPSGGSADYYVAVDGNDANPGTLLLPFATLDKARQAVRARIASGMTDNITVMMRGGTYYLSNTLAFSSRTFCARGGWRSASLLSLIRCPRGVREIASLMCRS
jgi:hypothetical protein